MNDFRRRPHPHKISSGRLPCSHRRSAQIYCAVFLIVVHETPWRERRGKYRGNIAAAGGIGILLFYGNGWLLRMNVATALRAALFMQQRCWQDLGMLAAGLWAAVC